MLKFGAKEAVTFSRNLGISLVFSLIGWFVHWLNFSLIGVLFLCAVFSWHITFEQYRGVKKDQAKAFFGKEKETIHEIFEEIPSWVYFPDVERAEWLNKLMNRLWPDVTHYAREFLKHNIEPNIQKSLPKKINNFSFETIDLGDKPPKITGVKLYTKHVEDEIILDANIFYAGDAKVSVKLSKFEAGIKDVEFKGTLRIVLRPLLRHPPFVGGIQIYFLTYPMLDFDLTNVASVLGLPGLYSLLRKALLTQLANYMVLPNKIVLPLSQEISASHLKFSEPKGVLMVKIVEAKDLSGHDLTSKSDPYVKITVSGEEHCTGVKMNTHNPVWENEVFYFTVLETSGVKLMMELFDKDDASKDDAMGSVSIPLLSLMERGHTDTWGDLADDEGSLHYICTWYGFTTNSNLIMKPASNASGRKPLALLSVYVDSAKNLETSDGEESEPSSRVKLNIASEERFTQDVFSTPNPVYHKNFHFLIEMPDLETLTMKVCDVDSDDVYGSTSILLSNVIISGPDMTIYRPFILRGGSRTSELLARLSVKYLVPGNKLKRIEKNSRNNLKVENSLNLDSLDTTAAGVSKDIEMSSERLESTSPPEPAVAAPVTKNSPDVVAPSTSSDSNNNAAIKPEVDLPVHSGKLADAPAVNIQIDSPSLGSTSTKLRRRRTLLTGEKKNNKGRKVRKGSKEVSAGDIELTLSYQQTHSKLVVVVHKCRELMKAMSTDSEAPDVYVKLYLMPHKTSKCKSEICKNSFFPVFDERFEFHVDVADILSTSLEIVVKQEKSFFTKVELGHVSLHLSNVDLDKPAVNWYQLNASPEDSS